MSIKYGTNWELQDRYVIINNTPTKVSSVYVWNWDNTATKIRPVWWQPWANTLAYYPLTQDANDYSWNNYNITTSWASSYTTDGALLPNSNHAGLLVPFSIDTSNNYTFSFWCNPLYHPSIDDMRGIDCTESTSNRLISLWDDMYIIKHWWGSSNSTKFWTDWSYTTNTRYYVTYTIDNWTVKTYLNWVQLWTKTWVSWHTCALRFWQEWNMWADRHWYWYMKDIIIENKVWTADEILNYFNVYKSLYWLE